MLLVEGAALAWVENQIGPMAMFKMYVISDYSNEENNALNEQTEVTGGTAGHSEWNICRSKGFNFSNDKAAKYCSYSAIINSLQLSEKVF